MLKICLQLLVCSVIALRLLLIFGHLRRLWLHDGRRQPPSLAAQFRLELRRRGLLPSPPLPEIKGTS